MYIYQPPHVDQISHSPVFVAVRFECLMSFIVPALSWMSLLLSLTRLFSRVPSLPWLLLIAGRCRWFRYRWQCAPEWSRCCRVPISWLASRVLSSARPSGTWSGRTSGSLEERIECKDAITLASVNVDGETGHVSPRIEIQNENYQFLCYKK